MRWGKLNMHKASFQLWLNLLRMLFRKIGSGPWFYSCNGPIRRSWIRIELPELRFVFPFFSIHPFFDIFFLFFAAKSEIRESEMAPNLISVKPSFFIRRSPSSFSTFQLHSGPFLVFPESHFHFYCTSFFRTRWAGILLNVSKCLVFSQLCLVRLLDMVPGWQGWTLRPR